MKYYANKITGHGSLSNFAPFALSLSNNQWDCKIIKQSRCRLIENSRKIYCRINDKNLQLFSQQYVNSMRLSDHIGFSSYFLLIKKLQVLNNC